jgi:hypothetical protein
MHVQTSSLARTGTRTNRRATTRQPPRLPNHPPTTRQAAISEMIAPGALVLFTPIVVGALFGTQCLAGVLAGSLVRAS